MGYSRNSKRQRISITVTLVLVLVLACVFVFLPSKESETDKGEAIFYNALHEMKTLRKYQTKESISYEKSGGFISEGKYIESVYADRKCFSDIFDCPVYFEKVDGKCFGYFVNEDCLWVKEEVASSESYFYNSNALDRISKMEEDIVKGEIIYNPDYEYFESLDKNTRLELENGLFKAFYQEGVNEEGQVEKVQISFKYEEKQVILPEIGQKYEGEYAKSVNAAGSLPYTEAQIQALAKKYGLSQSQVEEYKAKYLAEKSSIPGINDIITELLGGFSYI